MKQIVFLKQVPASTEVRIDPVTHTLMRAGTKSQTNPDDLHALQAAVEIRKQLGGTIVAVTMGPPQAESVLREAMMFGADEAILLSDRAFAGSDTWSTSYILSAAVKKLLASVCPPDGLILLFGKQAIDGDTAQVGPGVAARLSFPQLTEVRCILSVNEQTIEVEKISDQGTLLLQATLPCVLTIVKEANNLPAPTLRAWEQSRQKTIIRWSAADLGLDSSFSGLNGSPTRVVKTEVPTSSHTVQWLADEAELSRLILSTVSYK